MNKFIIAFFSIYLGIFIYSQAQTEKQLFKRAMTKMEERDFEAAGVDFSMVIKLNPKNDAAFFNRGYSRMVLGDNPGALQDFTEALDINPANPDGYYHRGRVKLNLEDYLGAMQDFNIALNARPKESKFLQARSQAKSGLQDFRGAIADLTLAIKLTKGRNMDYIFDRAEAFINIRQFKLAVRDLDRVVKIRPKDPNAYNARASIKFRGGDLDGACLDWSKAGELGDVNAYSLIREHCNN